MSKRILAIHAHPDDIEILAGGTVALLAARGHSIVVATVANGDCGSAELGPAEIAAVRKKEAQAAAAVVGAEYVCAEVPDLRIFNDDETRRKVTELIRRARPDLILTASPVDYLCDHEATSGLVRDSCFSAPAPNYKTWAPEPAEALHAIPHLYFMNPITNHGRDAQPVVPDFVVNVESAMETKRRLLACHASQRDWLMRHHGEDDYMNSMDRWTRQCGAAAGITYGEGFRQYVGHPYPTSPLLAELLGSDLVVRRS